MIPSTMRRAAALAACVGLAVVPTAAGGAARSEVEDSSRTLPGGERILEQSIVVPATVEEVWAAFTTSDGYRSWAAPVAEVDFRLGGVIESSYDLEAESGTPGNIKNEILAYSPHRMIALKNIQAPANTRFDAEIFQRLHTVVFFEEAGPQGTRVTIAQPGYRRGDPYDGVYRHFEWGNRWSLERLRQRFEQGPIDWPSVLGGRSNQPESK